MKKKITLILSLVFMMTFLCSCGSSDTTYNGYTEKELQEEAQTSIENIKLYSAMIGDDYDAYQEKIKEYEDNYGASETDVVFSTLSNNGYSVAKKNMEVELSAVPTWLDITKEYGEVKSIKDDEFTVSKSGSTVTTDTYLEFEDKEVVFELVYDYNKMQITGITIDPVYSVGEKMAKAGQNTLISISIVFAVLILISLIIYCFRFFAVIENRKKAKAEENTAVVTENASAAPQDNAGENLVDDTELVAVIAAAIAAYEGTGTEGFVVRSIKRR